MRRSITLLLYRALSVLIFPLLLLYLARRVFKNRAYLGGLAQRFGFLPPAFRQTVPGSIWLHAVSVGEVIAAQALLAELRRRLPAAPLFVSCSTLAGRQMASQKLSSLAAGVFFAPLDLAWIVRRVLRHLRPAVVVVMETEIWPNLFRQTEAAGARLVIVNGRISDKALPRYRRLAWFFRAVLPSAARVLAQDETAAARYRELGAVHVENAGNLKYDFDPDSARLDPALAAFLARLDPAEVVVAASTMPPAAASDPDEDEVVAEVFARLAAARPRLLMVLAPRRPERFSTAAALLEAKGIPFLRRSALTPDSQLPLPGVLLLDTIGELASLFACAEAVFVGGTLVDRGGHNILEPAAHGCAIVTGPNMQNFAEIAAAFRAAGAVVTVQDASSLATELVSLLDDPARREALGRKALQQAAARRGATGRAASAIVELYEQAVPSPPRFNPVAPVWRGGLALHRALSRPERLPIPVVSIGNIAMGGTGKTPMVLWLSEKLTLAGFRVAVLTRGYGRSSSKPLALPAGARVPVHETGEEPQLLLKAGLAAVGVARRRAALGRQMAAEVRPDVFLLDDGFQHWALQRDLDIVLIDTLDPLQGGLPPAGRLREEISALSRAHLIVLTRTEPHRTYEGLIQLIRRANPTAPIFRSRVEAAAAPAAPGERFAAFCGLAQPETFRATLRQLGCEPAFFRVFPDHHKYSEVELTAMAALAPKLVTTEKDLLNIPERLRGALPIASLPVRMVLEDEPRFLDAVLAVLQRRC